jgi:hypothetical protein
LVTEEGIEPFPPTGARTLDSRTAFYYGVVQHDHAAHQRRLATGTRVAVMFIHRRRKP